MKNSTRIILLTLAFVLIGCGEKETVENVGLTVDTCSGGGESLYCIVTGRKYVISMTSGPIRRHVPDPEDPKKLVQNPAWNDDLYNGYLMCNGQGKVAKSKGNITYIAHEDKSVTITSVKLTKSVNCQ